MDTIDLTALVDDQLDLARVAHSGRHASTVSGSRERDLRQTVIAIAEGHALNDHESPGEATLQVLRGAVTFSMGDTSVELAAGQFLVIPPHRHGLTATTDAAVLLTVATRA
ncbi:cupin domain-containing protein [Demequina sediminicola]|uniref:cupin domain-containing protein n=1 Tax=Demequina sediminicola TaxID=1095026 RepID=UPI00078577F4|nr:cupin domain-containing protein [Demequina sediminicola]